METKEFKEILRECISLVDSDIELVEKCKKLYPDYRLDIFLIVMSYNRTILKRMYMAGGKEE